MPSSNSLLASSLDSCSIEFLIPFTFVKPFLASLAKFLPTFWKSFLIFLFKFYSKMCSALSPMTIVIFRNWFLLLLGQFLPIWRHVVALSTAVLSHMGHLNHALVLLSCVFFTVWGTNPQTHDSHLHLN